MVWTVEFIEAPTCSWQLVRAALLIFRWLDLNLCDAVRIVVVSEITVFSVEKNSTSRVFADSYD